jgi:predicted transcriptional regulator YheO
MTIQEFIKNNNITSTAIQVEKNPSMENSHNMNNYKVTLKYNGKKATFNYSMGTALKGKPTTAEVLDCLALDSSYGNTFDDFLMDFGYDTDSISALRIFKAVQKNTKKLVGLIGDSLLKELIDLERL